MTYDQKCMQLKWMIAASACGFCAFMAVWVAGCYIADDVLSIPADSWRMFFGYVVGSAGMILMHTVSSAIRNIPNT